MSTQDIPELYSDYKEALKQLSELTEEEVAFNKSAVKAKNEIYRKRIELIQKRELIQYFLTRVKFCPVLNPREYNRYTYNVHCLNANCQVDKTNK